MSTEGASGSATDQDVPSSTDQSYQSPHPPLKYWGGKKYVLPLLRELTDKVAPLRHRVEVFGGGLRWTLSNNPEGYSEVVNDINRDLMAFWTVMSHPLLFEQFKRRAEAIPFSESIFKQATDYSDLYIDPEQPTAVEAALRVFVQCRMSWAGGGKSFQPIVRNRTRRGMNENVSAWLSAVDGLPQVHERMRRICVLCRDWRPCIESQDGPGTLFYCDPPYMPETRTSPRAYVHELSYDQHVELLHLLGGISGKFMLSGYRCEMYDDAASRYNWNRHGVQLPNNTAGGDKKRLMLECVWTNF